MLPRLQQITFEQAKLEATDRVGEDEVEHALLGVALFAAQHVPVVHRLALEHGLRQGHVAPRDPFVHCKRFLEKCTNVAFIFRDMKLEERKNFFSSVSVESRELTYLVKNFHVHRVHSGRQITGIENQCLHSLHLVFWARQRTSTRHGSKYE